MTYLLNLKIALKIFVILFLIGCAISKGDYLNCFRIFAVVVTILSLHFDLNAWKR